MEIAQVIEQDVIRVTHRDGLNDLMTEPKRVEFK